MIVVYPYNQKDQEQALRNAQWIAELEASPAGQPRRHKFLIVRDHRVDPEIANKIETLLGQSFPLETLLVENDAWDKWPESCNLMFSVAARHIAAQERPEPWLWLEPDAIPLRKGWLDALAAQYEAAGKPFMGDRVAVGDVPVHMSGVGIYPPKVIEHAGVALISQEIAWDVMAAFQILPLMHETKLIEHAWKHPTFPNWAAVEAEVDLENAVLFHSSKDGSLIGLLRTFSASKGDATREKEGAGAGSVRSLPSDPRLQGRTNDCDILIKTYPKDYEWLSYCLRGLEKFAIGFRRIIVAYPAGANAPDIPFKDGVTLLQIQEHGNPYLFQQAVKFSAHEWTDAPFILHIDSDTVPCAVFTPNTFMREGLPLWLITPYADVETPWQEPTEKFLGEKVEYEFMRRFPILIPRQLHWAASQHCLAQHGKSATEYIISQETFSEFNALGAFAYYRGSRAGFKWLDTTHAELPPLVAIQSWSHGGLTNELRDKFETILGGGANIAGLVSATAVPSAHPLAAAYGDNEPEYDAQHKPMIHQTKEGWWVIDHDTHISKWVEDEGRIDHDVWMLPRLLPEINIGDTVVDAGAFIGDHTIAYLNKVGPDGKVIAFEPHPDAAECLRRNTLGKVEVHQIALSADETVYPFEIAPNAGASTLVSGAIGEGSILVQARTLDSFNLQRLDYLKIDVEGHELKVLQGAEKTIERCLPKILIEINKWALIKQGIQSRDLFNWLRNHGYNWQAVQPLLIADPPQYDVLCRPLTREAKNVKQIPWAAKLESEAEVKDLVTRLKEFCVKREHTRFVKGELVIQGLLRPRDIGYSWTVYRKKRNARKRRAGRFGDASIKPVTPEEAEKQRIRSEKKKEYMRHYLARKKKERPL